MRFPGFEGEWELKKLSAYLYENKERNRNGEFNKSDVLSVSGDCGIVNQIELLGRSFAGKSVADYHVVRTDDIVYTKSPLKEYPYGIVKYNNGQDGIVSTLYAVYHHKDNVDGQFVEYYFTNPQRTNRYFKPIVRIGAKHDMKIGNEEVLDSFVVFPGLEEQRKITEMLSLLDLRIAIQNKVIEKYESLIKALTDKIVDDLLKGRMVPFNQMYIQAGEGGTPSTSVGQYYLNGTIPFVKIDDLSSKYLVKNKDFINDLGLSKSSAWLIPSNSVIYSNGATIGAISINTYPVSTKQGILGVVPAADANTEYLYYLMCSRYFSEQVQRIIAEGTMKTAYLKDMNKIQCPLPSLREQKRIVAGLSALSSKLESELAALLSYESIKRYLLINLFI